MQRVIVKTKFGEKGVAQISISKSKLEIVFDDERRFKFDLEEAPEYM